MQTGFEPTPKYTAGEHLTTMTNVRCTPAVHLGVGFIHSATTLVLSRQGCRQPILDYPNDPIRLYVSYYN